MGCMYCGQNVRAGGSCSKSPSKYHVVDNGPDYCVYCGQKVRAGGSCSKSPHKYHESGTGGDKCIYCGQKVRAGGSCSKSPTRSHVVRLIANGFYNNRINSGWEKLRRFAMQLFPAGYAER